MRRLSRSVTPTASVHYVRMSGSSPSLPGHVRARRAADCAFGGLVVLTLRNRLPFTRVHSHAGTQKSSGAFFLDMGTERCMFQAGGLRNALRAFEAVRPTDVMFNVDNRSKSDAYIYWCSGSRRYCI